MFGFDDEHHPWHQIPGMVALLVAEVPLFVAVLPVILVEEAVGAPSFFHEGECSVSKAMAGYPAMACGYVVAAPFFILGLPFEFSSSDDHQEVKPPQPGRQEPVSPQRGAEGSR
jgi:hypothetical protein